MMKLIITKNETDFDNLSAWKLIQQILNKPNAIIGLSTGQTPKNMHVIVSKIYAQAPFDTSQLTIFNVDETMNTPVKYVGRCFNMLNKEIIQPLHINIKNFIMPCAHTDKYDEEIKKFETAIQNKGEVDFQILGLGTNGHIGFNQPGSPFESETRIVALLPEHEIKVRKENEVPDNIKLAGLTRGIKNIMNTKQIMLFAKGKEKANIVKLMLMDSINTEVPASILRLHPNCEFIIDADAASQLSANFKL